MVLNGLVLHRKSGSDLCQEHSSGRLLRSSLGRNSLKQKQDLISALQCLKGYFTSHALRRDQNEPQHSGACDPYFVNLGRVQLDCRKELHFKMKLLFYLKKKKKKILVFSGFPRCLISVSGEKFQNFLLIFCMCKKNESCSEFSPAMSW